MGNLVRARKRAISVVYHLSAIGRNPPVRLASALGNETGGELEVRGGERGHCPHKPLPVNRGERNRIRQVFGICPE
jgi:hypothetical protein